MDRKKRNHSLSITRLYENQNFPSLDRFDLLIVMGGPMNIYEYEKYPWLRKEKKHFSKKLFLQEKQYLEFALALSLLLMP